MHEIEHISPIEYPLLVGQLVNTPLKPPRGPISIISRHPQLKPQHLQYDYAMTEALGGTSQYKTRTVY